MVQFQDNFTWDGSSLLNGCCETPTAIDSGEACVYVCVKGVLFERRSVVDKAKASGRFKTGRSSQSRSCQEHSIASPFTFTRSPLFAIQCCVFAFQLLHCSASSTRHIELSDPHQRLRLQTPKTLQRDATVGANRSLPEQPWVTAEPIQSRR
jgi:hypothetical protein